ncbi:MAG: hypothetical protein U0183_33945 [Polyangiaceae bacterium]
MKRLGAALRVTFALAGGFVLPATASAAPRTVDRVVVRYFAPETGGAARPRFVTERELAFFARVESRAEGVEAVKGDYPTRFVRAALDRIVAEDMLAQLQVRRGVEPPELPRLADEARAELELRVGGPSRLAAIMDEESFDDGELRGSLMRRVRAAYYVDRAIQPILRPSEEELRSAFRTSLHPLRSFRFEDVRPEMARWLVQERLRLVALDFLQAARARVTLAFVAPLGGS